MQKVIFSSEIQDYSAYIEQSVIDYIGDDAIETYESFEDYDLIAFDWYNLNDTEDEPAQILIYIDREDLFFICENEASYKIAESLFVAGNENEYALYLFFRNLLKGSTKHLENIEGRISEIDDAVAEKATDEIRERIIDLRNEILQLKKYYEQFEFLFDEICDNDNRLFGRESLQYFEVLRNRSIRLVSQVMNLREYVSQVREAYQSQIGIEQNNLMKVFTLVTSIFLPLTLIVGWYGMNLKMPEFGWEHGYLFVVGLCVAVGAVWLLFFKKSKMFK